MKHEFLVVYATNTADLELFVENELNSDKGWYLVGGPFIKDNLFYQALTREFDEDGEDE